MTLLPCHACGRHVKSSHPACPFCGATRSCDEKPARVEPVGRRLKAIALGAAIGVSACGTTQAAYGGSPVPEDAGKDAPSDAATDGPGAQPAYGAVVPPNDGGTQPE
jgi:hypothetical protein